MTERDRTRTLNGKFDARCVTCGGSPYCLWVDDAPPPIGCSDGYDQEPWRCPFVYNNFVMIVVKLDYTGAEISEAGKLMMKRLGAKGDELIAHIRSGKSPEEWRKKCGTKLRAPVAYQHPSVN